MSPQFVDFDGDGRLDIVAGIFDGSPHLVRGTAAGWAKPEQILDREGERIVLNMFWNFDTKRWDETDRYNGPAVRDADGKVLPHPKGHMTSAVAFDWDKDGDLDLLLGDHSSGRVYRRINEGSAREPAFSLENELVYANGAPIDVPGTVATLRIVDWNGDGRLDLACGGMGDAYGNGLGGGVVVYPNTTASGETTFGAPITVLERSAKGASEPLRPDSGIYMDFADHDGDGDLDMLVGGYSHWHPAGRTLTPEETQRSEELQRRIAEFDAQRSALIQGAQRAAEGRTGEDAEKAYTEAYAALRPELETLGRERSKLAEELDALVPAPKRRSFVWLYERLPSPPAAAGGG